jgi:IstB-like ATP binding protein
MRSADADAARVELFLADLRLPAIKQVWAQIAEQSDKEGWPAARFLAALAEHEIADRGRRRIERHLVEARLPVGKTLDSFDFEVVPMISKAQVVALTAGDSWLQKGANLLLFGPCEPLHNAHLSMSLEFQHFLQRIPGRRTPQTPGGRSALHVGTFQIGRLDDPRRALTKLTRRELTILD